MNLELLIGLILLIFVVGCTTDIQYNQPEDVKPTAEGGGVGYEASQTTPPAQSQQEAVPVQSPESITTPSLDAPNGETNSEASVPSELPSSEQTTSNNVISSCVEIVKSGDYVLDRDITFEGDSTVPDAACLRIHDTTNVNLDCQGYSITGPYTNGPYAIYISEVQGFSLNDCILESKIWTPFYVSKSSDGTISENTFVSLGAVRVRESNNLVFEKNNFQSMYEQFYSTNNILRDNVFTPIAQLVFGSVILSQYGSDNRIIGNTIDGNSDGIFREKSYENVAADDGIVIGDENGDVIQDNTISDVWDCGIETIGVISDTKFTGNTITNAGLCGIGGWYHNSWKNNVVTSNVVDNAPMMFYFFRTYGLRPANFDELKRMPKEDAVYFQDNQFSSNRLINAKEASNFPYSTYIAITPFSATTPTVGSGSVPGERDVTAADLVLKNNKFTNNNFGATRSAPVFQPAEMVVDGGGNICSKATDQSYQFSC